MIRPVIRFNKKFTKTFVDGMGPALVNSSSSIRNDDAHYKFTKEKRGMKGFPGIRKN